MSTRLEQLGEVVDLTGALGVDRFTLAAGEALSADGKVTLTVALELIGHDADKSADGEQREVLALFSYGSAAELVGRLLVNLAYVDDSFAVAVREVMNALEDTGPES